jgi:hypothetical protein
MGVIMKNSNDKIMKSVMGKLGNEGIEYVEKNGELPAVKLTCSEMNALRGGLFKELLTMILNAGKIIVG